MSDLSEGWAARKVDGRLSKGFIRGYQDLEVYQNSYDGMLKIYREILPKLPRNEYDLNNQLRRSCKAVPRLIAEGHSKRHQKKGFQKYIDDSMAEANETTVSLCQVRDLCGIDCGDQIILYDIISRQLYKLSIAWQRFTTKGLYPTQKPPTILAAQPIDHQPNA